MRSDVDCSRPGTDTQSHAAAPSTTTGLAEQASVNAAAPIIRRGRGTFQRRLRTADLEEYQQRSNGDGKSAIASAVAALTLPVSVQPRGGANRAQTGHPTSGSTSLTSEPAGAMAGQNGASSVSPVAAADRACEQVTPDSAATADARFAGVSSMPPKKDIPLEQVKQIPVWREGFGVFDENVVESDTVRQLLFRGEKRRRYCMIVGDLQNASRVVNLRLFGHRGLKPFQLQNKLIRLINLSISRLRVRKEEIHSIFDAEGGGEEGDSTRACDAQSGETRDTEQHDLSQSSQHGRTPSDNAAAADESNAADARSKDSLRDAHEDHTSSSSLPSVPPHTSVKDTSDARSDEVNRVTEDEEDNNNNNNNTIHTSYNNNKISGAHDGADGHASCAIDVAESKAAAVRCDPSAGIPMDDYLSHILAQVDGNYQERANDEVVPLTVQHSDGATVTAHETSLANSPVLTAKYFTSLTDYFMREFRFLLGMSDVQAQNVSVDFNLGTAYYCLPRHNSYDSPLKHVTFCEFIERMNQDSMQMNFIRDCPPCVSRAVDMECGALHHEASLTTVRIVFFSNERQSRSIARAMWDCEQNRFKLLDMENMGVTFSWTVFSLDETFARRKSGPNEGGRGTTTSRRVLDEVSSPAAATHTNDRRPSLSHTSPDEHRAMHTAGDDTAASSTTTTTTTRAGPHARSYAPGAVEDDDIMRNKTIAYPFEVEFRAFRRWRQHGEHPAAALAEAILDKLSIAEHNLIQHGSSIGYERMDLSHVCEVDYASEDFNVELIIVDHTSRGRPQGTDILVDNTTSLYIENFAAARQLKEKIAQHGPAHVAAMQNAKNNNYIRNKTNWRGGGRSDMPPPFLSLDVQKAALQPPSRLTFFRSRGSTVHWRFRPTRSVEENIAPLTEALSFVQQVLHTANNIERTSARGGAGPEAI